MPYNKPHSGDFLGKEKFRTVVSIKLNRAQSLYRVSLEVEFYMVIWIGGFLCSGIGGIL